MADTIAGKKESYTIGEVAGMTELSVDTLRFYEKSGVIGTVLREKGGRRQFSTHDVEWLKFVNCLKSTGMALDLIREYRLLMEQGDETASRRKELMIHHKHLLDDQMTELKAAMERINFKIDYYDEIIRKQGF